MTDDTKTDTLLLSSDGLAVAQGGRTIVSGVDLDLHPGEIVTLIGPNGAGKTTLVRALLGLLPSAKGTVTKRKGLQIGYLPQRFALDETLPMTVARFLELCAPSKRAAIGAVLAEVGAAGLETFPLQRISGGELRRVLLAQALLRDPDLLVLDEPSAGVDVTGQNELYALIKRIRDQRGCGILLVSHDLHLVMAATDRVICLNHHICCSGQPEAVSQHPEYLALFGPDLAPGLAVYTHDHDHHHDLHGDPVAAAQDDHSREHQAHG